MRINQLAIELNHLIKYSNEFFLYLKIFFIHYNFYFTHSLNNYRKIIKLKLTEISKYLSIYVNNLLRSLELNQLDFSRIDMFK